MLSPWVFLTISRFLSTLSLRRATFTACRVTSGVADFYPRSPCGERPISIQCITPSGQFLSTLSLRRATGLLHCLIIGRINFYPRSPCGERLVITVIIHRKHAISIHALLAESDFLFCWCHRPECQFLSTLSLRRATRCTQQDLAQHIDFYPRSPCGERLALFSGSPLIARISIHALLAESDQSGKCRCFPC